MQFEDPQLPPANWTVPLVYFLQESYAFLDCEFQLKKRANDQINLFFFFFFLISAR